MGVIKYKKLHALKEEFKQDWIEGILNPNELMLKYECSYNACENMAHKFKIKRKQLKDRINLEEFKTDYISKMSMDGLQSKYNISEPNIQRLAKDLSINRSRRIYNFNEYYFDNIDTEEKAYFLGLLYADGYNAQYKNSIKIKLQAQDNYILEKFLDEINCNKLVNTIIDNVSLVEYKEVEIHSKILSDKLAELGCVQAKSHILKFPNFLYEDLVHHFIRGYFDGDGSISIPHNKNKIYNTGISFCGSYNFINNLQNILVECCLIGKTEIKEENSIYRLNIGGGQQIMRVLEYIYEDSHIYLIRKYEKFLHLKKNKTDKGWRKNE